MQVVKEILKEILSYAKELVRVIGNGEDVSEEYLKNVARTIEKFRYKYLEQIKDIKELGYINQENMEIIDDEYYAKQVNSYLYIHIPEVIPFIKGLDYYTNDRIKTNLARVCRPYNNIFIGKICIYVKVHASNKNYDIDNRAIKPISDGLIEARLIKDDNIEKMMYIAEGVYSENNYTEVYIFKENIIKEMLKNIIDTS